LQVCELAAIVREFETSPQSQKALTMPLSRNQISAVKDLLRRASELIADAQNVVDVAGDRPAVIRLNTLRRNMANEIADLGREVRR
jgi:HPt (histidine-containing phosphotransfer) domain-containing protein